MDFIDREQTIKKVRAVANEWLTEMIYGSYEKGFRFGTDIAIQTIFHDVPSAEKTGKWVEEKDRQLHWHCSNCGYTISLIKMDGNYCPNCGARMVSDEDKH